MVNKTLKFLKKFKVELILLIVGLFYLGVPHSVHQMFSPDWLLGINFPHIFHQGYGAVLLFILAMKLFMDRD